MPEVTRSILRRVGRTLEWFIVGQMAKELPPQERLFLFYEVISGRRDHDERVARAREHHGRGGYCIGDYTLVTLSREELGRVIGSAEWMARRIDRPSALAPNEARCVVIQDAPVEPTIHIFSARSAHHVSSPGATGEGGGRR